MIATLRYEFRMQIRRPVLWIVYGLTYAATVAAFGSTYVTLDLGFGQGLTSKTAMVSSASLLMSLLPIVYGCLLADRLSVTGCSASPGSWTRPLPVAPPV